MSWFLVWVVVGFVFLFFVVFLFVWGAGFSLLGSIRLVYVWGDSLVWFRDEWVGMGVEGFGRSCGFWGGGGLALGCGGGLVVGCWCLVGGGGLGGVFWRRLEWWWCGGGSCYEIIWESVGGLGGCFSFLR